MIAFVGVAAGYIQLSKLRRKIENSSKVLDIGLWRYSRHPNYFFELLIWISWALMAIGGLMFWSSTLHVIFMLMLLTHFTGIPHVEAQCLRDIYKWYQQTTIPFIPWFPRISQRPL